MRHRVYDGVDSYCFFSIEAFSLHFPCRLYRDIEIRLFIGDEVIKVANYRSLLDLCSRSSRRSAVLIVTVYLRALTSRLVDYNRSQRCLNKLKGLPSLPRLPVTSQKARQAGGGDPQGGEKTGIMALVIAVDTLRFDVQLGFEGNTCVSALIISST